MTPSSRVGGEMAQSSPEPLAALGCRGEGELQVRAAGLPRFRCPNMS